MQSYRSFGALDDQPQVVRDGAFVALDMLTDPADLSPNVLAASENLRFDVSGTTVRAGLARQFPAGQSIGTIFCACVFKPSADEDYLAFATASYLATFNLVTQEIDYHTFPPGEVISEDDAVDMVQGGIGAGTLPTLYILRGVNKTVLQFDANTGLITVAAGFAQGNFAVFYQDRIAVAQAQDVEVSDFLDFTNFVQLNQFQITKGGSDYLAAFQSYQGDFVLIGTRQGWYIAFFDPNVGTGGYLGNLNTDTSFIRQLTTEAGPVGPRARLEAMGNIWFIASNAIYAFMPNINNQLVVLGKPISSPIQPIVDRMCVRYAQRAAIERYGYRLYCAMPISDMPVAVSLVLITEKLTPGINLPFNLPVTLSTNSLAQVTTAEEHDLNVGDHVQLAGSTFGGLNGEFIVDTVPSDFMFSVRLNVSGTMNGGNRMTAQKLATRNNVIAVFNLNNSAWESIDFLPAGLFADWLLPVEESARRRLMVVDADAGPMLYESGDEDEVGTTAGGINLPFNLPVNLSAFNYATRPVAGRMLTRAMRAPSSYSQPGREAFPCKVRGCEVRATLDVNSELTMNLLVRTPNNRVWTGTRTFTAGQFETSDSPLRKMCGQRGLEAQIEIITTGGRPTIRSVSVQTTNVGRVEE